MKLWTSITASDYGNLLKINMTHYGYRVEDIVILKPIQST